MANNSFGGPKNGRPSVYRPPIHPVPQGIGKPSRGATSFGNTRPRANNLATGQPFVTPKAKGPKRTRPPVFSPTGGKPNLTRKPPFGGPGSGRPNLGGKKYL